MDFKVLDDVMQVNDEECFVWARAAGQARRDFHRRIGRRLRFGGAARGEELPEGRLGRGVPAGYRHRYLSKIYNDGWMREHGYAEAEVTLTAADVIRVKRQNGKTRDLIIVRPQSDRVSGAARPCSSRIFRSCRCFEENDAVGTIYEDQILNLALQGKDLRKLIMREVMGAAMPQVPANAPVERVTHLLSHESPAVFVEMEDGKLEIVTKFDLMDTVAGLAGASDGQLRRAHLHQCFSRGFGNFLSTDSDFTVPAVLSRVGIRDIQKNDED